MEILINFAEHPATLQSLQLKDISYENFKEAVVIISTNSQSKSFVTN